MFENEKMGFMLIFQTFRRFCDFWKIYAIQGAVPINPILFKHAYTIILLKLWNQICHFDFIWGKIPLSQSHHKMLSVYIDDLDRLVARNYPSIHHMDFQISHSSNFPSMYEMI